MRLTFKVLGLAMLFTASWVTKGLSQDSTINLSPNANLEELLDFALKNTISIKKAYIGEEIGEREIASAISGWYPQVNGTGSLNHFLIVPTSIVGGNAIQMGQENSSSLLFQANQTIFDPSLLQASRASKFIREQYKQTTETSKINTVVDVSKAYYDILTTEKQIVIIEENIIRLQKQYNDSHVQYEVGMVDKTDFKRAQISLNNSKAELKQTVEIRKYKYDYLKQLLGISNKYPLDLSYNDEDMESKIFMDTVTTIDPKTRIEFKQLETLQSIQQLNTQYHKWTFLPTLSAYGNYNFNYVNNSFTQLYTNNLPSSSVGLSLTMPIFQGMKRIQEVRRSELMETQLDWDMKELNNVINTEYSAAMASYKANIIEWKNSKDNVLLSEEVYNTLKLQYDSGIKTYLDLMTAETDLRTSQLNYLNALFAVLSSKIDVQKALGIIPIQ
ncbi:TolC family protein [Sphingobacterium hungaricum]|uniref:TolC family protein n=1 Tax=Sphingobacterium hungaricum TaxID=2082723 RepID=A0A928V0C2_9SPHI|nr:TolC family protein [Sphingobacterium hungaricum]MBE8714636.1 TolC family protein [Sphingobacterium hungaricum]